MEKKESNKLIAEFMCDGIFTCDGEDLYRFNKHPCSYIKNSSAQSVEDLFYDSRWDWLMAVVEKIYTLVDYRLSVPYNSLSRMYIHNPIELVYFAVVKFIEYYNSKSL